MLEDVDGDNRYDYEGVVVCENEVGKKWKKIREIVRDVLGYRIRKSRGWISFESWKGIEERK